MSMAESLPISESSLSNRKENKKGQGHPWLFLRMNKLLPFLLSLFLLVSCSSAQEDVAIDIALMQEPPTLDVQVNSSISGKMIAVGNIFEKLVNLDGNGDIACSLASSYSLSEDGRSLEFTLRDDVVFHDGSALDAKDAAASLNRWLRVYPAARDAAGGETFSADGSKVRIESDSSLLMLLMMMASSPQCAAIMPSETLSEDNDYSLSEYIGTGPYRISEWYPGDYIELERFGDYHERDASGPSVLRYIFVPDGTTRRLGLESGLYDAIDCVLSDDIPRLMENEGIKLIEGDESGSIALVLNKSEGIFSDLDNRRSLSLMIDRTGTSHETAPDTSAARISAFPDSVVISINEDGQSGLASVDAVFYGPRMSREMRGTSSYLISSRFWDEFRIAAEIRISTMLRRSGIPYSSVRLRRSDLADFPDMRKYSVSVCRKTLSARSFRGQYRNSGCGGISRLALGLRIMCH